MISGELFSLLLSCSSSWLLGESAGEVLIRGQIARQNCQGHYGVRAQDGQTVGWLDWRIQESLAEKDGHDGSGLDFWSKI